MTFLRCFRQSTHTHTHISTHKHTQMHTHTHLLAFEKAVCLNLSFHITKTKANDGLASAVGACGKTKNIQLHRFSGHFSSDILLEIGNRSLWDWMRGTFYLG